MTFKDQFTHFEWHTLKLAPFWVHSTIANVDGKIDDQEAAVLTEETAEAAFWKKGLAKELLVEAGKSMAELTHIYRADSRSAIEGLKETRIILEGKVSKQEASEFKKALLYLALKTAKSSGGWEGAKWTGKSISIKEKVGLDLVTSTLRISKEDIKELL